ncbi:hypothetical protein EPUL_005366, partial [Erysiphe pulchra]
VIVDALRRASAGRITAVIPYFGYARQDRRVRSARVPITAKVVADFLSSVGVDRVLTVDLHAEQIQGFFDVPVDNVFGSPILLEDMLQQDLKNPIVVSPDIGGVIWQLLINVGRAQYFTSYAYYSEVADRDCVLVDDMIDTSSTLCKAAEALKEHGAKRWLANPGNKYMTTRHNVGAWYVKQLANENDLSLKETNQFLGYTGNLNIGEKYVRLLVPTTFMNHNGKSIALMATFYHIVPEEILIAHDELNISPGYARLKYKGNNPNFYRLRIGIGHPVIKTK